MHGAWQCAHWPPPRPPCSCRAAQVSDKERQAQQDNLFKDVAGILVDKTVNPQTSRPYTLTMLERALRDVHFNPDPKKSAKQQALEVGAALRGPRCGGHCRRCCR